MKHIYACFYVLAKLFSRHLLYNFNLSFRGRNDKIYMIQHRLQTQAFAYFLHVNISIRSIIQNTKMLGVHVMAHTHVYYLYKTIQPFATSCGAKLTFSLLCRILSFNLYIIIFSRIYITQKCIESTHQKNRVYYAYTVSYLIKVSLVVSKSINYLHQMNK